MNIREEASMLSCKHMTSLAINERNNNYRIFMQHINTPNVPITQCGTLDEQKLQQGISIGKKNCIYKQPDYNVGSWEKQFKNILPDTFGAAFDVHSKKLSGHAYADKAYR
jgi:hypothetical protein